MHHVDDLSLLSRVAPSNAAGGGVRAHAQDVRRGRGSSTSRHPRINNDAREVDADEPIHNSLDDISSMVSSPSMSHIGTMCVATQDITAVYEGLEAAFQSNVRRRPATRLSSTAPVGDTQPMRSATSCPEVDKRLYVCNVTRHLWMTMEALPISCTSVGRHCSRCGGDLYLPPRSPHHAFDNSFYTMMNNFTEFRRFEAGDLAARRSLSFSGKHRQALESSIAENQHMRAEHRRQAAVLVKSSQIPNLLQLHDDDQ